jgi:diguanylate cyclase (GGDEF)-like protein/PAS domain S-box-containing protein
MNPSAEKLLGSDRKKCKGLPFSEVFQLLSVESRDPVVDLIDWCLASENKQCPAIEFYMKTETCDEAGKEYIVEAMLSALVDVDNNTYGVLVLIRDITSYKNRNSELSYLAYHDMLTGLVNRREFESRLQRLLEDSRLSGRQHVLFFLDLDHFKAVNDRCGHAAGDQLLKMLAEKFKQRLRREDSIGRLGGDEFGVLLVNCELNSAHAIGEKMRQDIEAFEFDWEGKMFKLGVSIGIAAITRDAESIDALMNSADSSCYTAKQKGRNQIHLHTPE